MSHVGLWPPDKNTQTIAGLVYEWCGRQSQDGKDLADWSTSAPASPNPMVCAHGHPKPCKSCKKRQLSVIHYGISKCWTLSMMNSAARDVDHTLGVLQELLYHLDGAPKQTISLRYIAPGKLFAWYRLEKHQTWETQISLRNGWLLHVTTNIDQQLWLTLSDSWPSIFNMAHPRC